jgi:glycine dehydrogenase subunit 1
VEAGALFITATPEPLSLGIVRTPGSFGADIAVGEGLSFGLPLNFGGPTLGIVTAKKEHVRQMCGRICGRTVDQEGRPSYTLTLSTREQHIRREKATSNICSNQALCATTAAIYLSLLGKNGMRELAVANASLAAYARNAFSKVGGVSLPFSAATFNEFAYETKLPASKVLAELSAEGIVGGVDLGRWNGRDGFRVLACCTELNSQKDIDAYAAALQRILK